MVPPPAEVDDERHKREEQERRAKRKAAKAKGSKSEAQLEKDRKRREHAKRVLSKQSAKRQKKEGPSAGKGKGKGAADDGGSSAFTDLFAKRAEGFLIDLNFRNAPPRPPVGPCFVGLGLEGELNDKWTKYKPLNAVEANYAWKLHSERDLGVPLAPSAMDLAGCYVDPTRPTKTDDGQEVEPAGPPDLHPDDAALIDWTGHTGDSAAEELQRRRDRRRAAALGVAAGGASAPGSTIKLAKKTVGFKSRVLSENIQSWMKKTTYLTNDQTRAVHQFKSLAETKKQAAEDIESRLKSSTDLTSDEKTIEAGFDLAAKQAAAGARRHPTKRGVTAVYDLPFLPDASTWGHTYTHVVLDQAPIPVRGQKRPPPNSAQLERAFVSDVEERRQGQDEKKQHSEREFECNLLVPGDVAASSSSEPTLYDIAQRYDMKVHFLRDGGPEAPNTNFVVMIDEENGAVTYRPILTRLQLNSGRPVGRSVAGTIFAKQAMQQSDVTEMEERIAEVDDDLAKKHKIGDYDDGTAGGGGGDRQDESAGGQKLEEDGVHATNEDDERTFD